MNNQIDPAGGLILDFIASKEAPNGYDTIFGNRQVYLTKPITQMTLDELIENQRGFAKGFLVDGKRTSPNSSASGRYQFMRDTLLDLKQSMKLTGREVFSPDLQDKLGFELLKRRGFAKFMAGQLSVAGFGDQLAMEWASFPVLSNSRQGAHRVVTRGQSYYVGDGVNKALVHADAVQYVLTQARDLFSNAPVAAVPAPQPISGPSVATVTHTANPEPIAPATPVAPPRTPSPGVPPQSSPAAAPDRPAGVLGRFASWLRGLQS